MSSWYLLKSQLTYQRKDFVSTNKVLPCWFKDQEINIKSYPYTNSPYITNKLNESAALNKGYVLEGAATATSSLIMISLFLL